MHIKVNPLVLAAALGLIGPAALADDESETDTDCLAGVWQRDGEDRPHSPVALGNRIEVIPFEETVLLDDGANGPLGSWTVDSLALARQVLVVGGTQVTRSFEAQGDRLAVRTTVQDGADATEYLDVFSRQA